MDYLTIVAIGGSSAAALTFLLRGWITERLKHSIKHEYDQKLEDYKSELDLKIQSLKHDNNISHLRTSLFFDHQRAVFTNILEAMCNVQKDFLEYGVDKELGLIRGVPRSSYNDFYDVIRKSDLFINKEIHIVVNLVLDALRSSMSYENENGDTVCHGDPYKSLDEFSFLYPRLVEILKNEIGIVKVGSAVIEVIVFGGVKILNNCCFEDIGLPEKGTLQIKENDTSLDIMKKGLDNYEYLRERLFVYSTY